MSESVTVFTCAIPQPPVVLQLPSQNGTQREKMDEFTQSPGRARVGASSADLKSRDLWMAQATEKECHTHPRELATSSGILISLFLLQWAH